MRILSRHSCLLFVLANLTACASLPAPPPSAPNTEVQYHAVADKHTRHYQLTFGETAVTPALRRDRDPPVYPPALIARRLPPVSVRAKLIVDSKGKVIDVRFADADHADAVRQAFEQAVRAATLQWTFLPLLIQHWKAMPDGGQKVVKSDPVPFSQDYVFRFSLVNGKPVVSGGTR